MGEGRLSSRASRALKTPSMGRSAPAVLRTGEWAWRSTERFPQSREINYAAQWRLHRVCKTSIYFLLPGAFSLDFRIMLHPPAQQEL